MARTIDDVHREQFDRAQKMATLSDGYWLCNKCEAEIQQTTGYASVHDGPFPMSGSGTVIQYAFPYCPACDGKPSTPHDTVDTK